MYLYRLFVSVVASVAFEGTVRAREPRHLVDEPHESRQPSSAPAIASPDAPSASGAFPDGVGVSGEPALKQAEELRANFQVQELVEQREEAHLRHTLTMSRLRSERDGAVLVERMVSRAELSTRDALLRRRVFLPSILGGAVSAGALGSVSGEGLVSFSSVSSERPLDSHWALTPRADVRIGDRVTFGGSLRIAHWSSGAFGATSSETAEVALKPRVGVLLPVSDSLIFWPKLGVLLAVGTNPWQPSIVGRIGADAEFGVLLPLTSHAFAQLAPRLAYAYEGDGDATKRFTVAVSGSLGLAF
jgi:hypothetical protein